MDVHIGNTIPTTARQDFLIFNRATVCLSYAWQLRQRRTTCASIEEDDLSKNRADLRVEGALGWWFCQYTSVCLAKNEGTTCLSRFNSDLANFFSALNAIRIWIFCEPGGLSR